MKRFISLVFVFSLIFCVFAERPLVRDIQAVAGKGGKINVYWTLPENPDEKITGLLLYRNTVPITTFEQISFVEPLAKLPRDASGYTDYVQDFADYFYAIIAVTDEPYNLVLVSINSTVNGCHLNPQKNTAVEKNKDYEKLYPDGSSREMPLPYIDFVDGINKDEQNILSELTVNAAKTLARPTKTKKDRLSVYYFEEDLVSPDSGDDYLLFDILKNYFVQKNYQRSISEFERLIGTNINASTRIRANFYMGEAYYMLGEYEEAIKIFCRTESAYPNLSKRWLDSSLDLIK